jgi:hypothetical protein
MLSPVGGAFLRRSRDVVTFRLLRLRTGAGTRSNRASCRVNSFRSRAEGRGETQLRSLGSNLQMFMPQADSA